jgi:5-methylcytosine-specific restriction endonuclease McrA
MRPEFHTLYQTSAWKRLSAEVRAGATRCTWCLKPTRRLVADHVIPLEQRPDLALDRSNLVPSCLPCNTRRGRNAKIPEVSA